MKPCRPTFSTQICNHPSQTTHPNLLFLFSFPQISPTPPRPPSSSPSPHTGKSCFISSIPNPNLYPFNPLLPHSIPNPKTRNCFPSPTPHVAFLPQPQTLRLQIFIQFYHTIDSNCFITSTKIFKTRIAEAHARRRPIDASVDLEAIARSKACENLSGDDLFNMMERAAMVCMEDYLDNGSPVDTVKTIKAKHSVKAQQKVTPFVSKQERHHYSRWILGSHLLGANGTSG
ncbi:hypothetical protein Droror1_Dr00018096 [Drosera rotundifolia]